MEVKSSTKHSKLVDMNEIEVRRTELCYITSVNRSTRTFFAQLCKFTNEELIQLNDSINIHCSKLASNGDINKPKLNKLHKGDIVCAKFATDGCWYRALVLDRDNQKQSCSVLFVDYGNFESLNYKDLVQVKATELAAMERAPFGISCFLLNSESLGDKEGEHLLDCLAQNYVMIKVLERQTKLQWKVDIPMHAYNIPFWLIYKPELCAECGRKNIASPGKAAVQPTSSPKEEQPNL